jgi:hypothetical protein
VRLRYAVFEFNNIYQWRTCMKGLLGTIATAICLFLPSLPMAATQYEAENATRSGGAAINTNHPGYTGTGFVDGYFNSATAQTAFTVSASAAGSATITLRYSAGNGTSTNTGLYVNGTKIKNISCTGTANWDTWASQTETVSLNTGNNTIAYKAETSSGNSINLDNIVVQSTAITYSLTVLAGPGGTRTAPATSPTVVNQGVATTIAAAPAVGYVFLNWTVTSGAATIASATSASTTVTLNSGNATVSANFALKTYQLAVSVGSGGTRIAPATIPITVNHGAATTITVSPNSGYAFANWTITSGTAAIANPSSANTTVTLTNGTAAIQANFTPINVTYTLTMANDGHGATSPAGTVTVNSGAANPIAATPASGYQFLNWTVTAGTATFASATSAGTTVTLASNAAIRANFTPTNQGGVSGVTYAQISGPVAVTTANTVVLALPFTAPSAGYITVVATGLYGTNDSYSHEQRGLESFITLNSTSGGSLSGFSEKAPLNGSAQYVNETAGFQVSAGSNTVRLIVSPRTTLTATTYDFAKCRMTVVYSPLKM